jgi:antitoxin CptB
MPTLFAGLFGRRKRLRLGTNLAMQRPSMEHQTTELDAYRRKLLWRATHRGLKELDLVLGGFAKQHVGALSKTELDQFSEIVALADCDLFAWLMREKPAPIQRWPLLSRVLAHKP